MAYANDNDLAVFAGTGTEGFSGDGGPASQASLHEPTGVAVGGDGTVYISDSGNFRVRAVAPDGTISTVAGTGQLSRTWSEPDPVPEGARGTEVEMIPGALAVGPDGTLYIADNSRAQVLALSRDGRLSVVAGSGALGFSGDGGPATEATFRTLAALAVAPDGTLYIADRENFRVRAVSPDGVITTVAGNGGPQVTAAGGTATSVPMVPMDIAVDADGAVWIVSGMLLVRLAGGRVATITRPAEGAPTTWGVDGAPSWPPANPPVNEIQAVTVSADGAYALQRDKVLRFSPDGVRETVASFGGVRDPGTGPPIGPMAATASAVYVVDVSGNQVFSLVPPPVAPVKGDQEPRPWWLFAMVAAVVVVAVVSGGLIVLRSRRRV